MKVDMMELNFDKRNQKFKPEEHLSDLKQWALAGKFKNLKVYKECWIDQVKKRLGYKDEKVLGEIFEEHLKMEKLYLENTDMGEVYEVDPLDFVHNVYNYSAIIIDNGTFFANQRQLLPPAVKVQTYLMGARYEKKHQGNYYLTEGQNEMLGQLYDLQQGDIKISMNTAYGASQNPYSKMYNKALGAAITCKGRSIVATSALIVESVMANYIPHNFDALMTFISEVENEKTVFNELIKTAPMQADDDMIIEHIGVDEDYYMYDALKVRISKMSQYDKTRLYYKNNLYAWLELPWVQNQLKLVVQSMNGVNVPFLDPYEVPKESSVLTSDLYQCAIELLYGYYWDKGDYLRDEWEVQVTHSAQDTIKKMKRKSVTLIDTDSNMVLIEDLYQYLKARFDGLMTNFDKDDRWFTLSNIATKIATECVDYGLAKYIDRSNVLPEYNHYAEMKNELDTIAPVIPQGTACNSFNCLEYTKACMPMCA